MAKCLSGSEIGVGELQKLDDYLTEMLPYKQSMRPSNSNNVLLFCCSVDTEF